LIVEKMIARPVWRISSALGRLAPRPPGQSLQRKIMNPNEILNQLQAQQQAALQNAQHIQLAVLLIWLAGLIVTAWVLFMFYARLRDIADELRKIRVTYEMEQDRTIRGAARPPAATSGENPFASEARYMPNK
jgi:hypothetical protein